MAKHKIDIAAIQETNLDTNQIEKRAKYTWYTSGEIRLEPEGTFSTGAAIVIRSKWEAYIKEVTPINDSTITMTLNGSLPLTIISAYAPPANHKEEEKTVCL